MLQALAPAPAGPPTAEQAALPAEEPSARQPAPKDQQHPSALLRPDTPQPSTSHPAQPAQAPGLAAALALQRLPGSPRQEPAGSPGTGLLCAQREGRRFRQMPPVKIAAGIAKARRGPLIVGNNSMLKWVNYGEKKKIRGRGRKIALLQRAGELTR